MKTKMVCSINKMTFVENVLIYIVKDESTVKLICQLCSIQILLRALGFGYCVKKKACVYLYISDGF